MTRIGGSWLTSPPTRAVLAALSGGGAQALLVGGCVRNALLGAPVADIDIATDAIPERVIEIAGQNGIRAVPTGIEHGTVTLVQGGIAHEVTTFRRDIETDGRRATVVYSTRVEDDAARRDFTMNALYATPEGLVIDPLGGLPDLRAGRVRFIGSARDRIREDYLRSLRFFRFHAWYGDPTGGTDPVALAAIADNLDGLDGLSRERVGAEIAKLMAAVDPAPAVAAMRACGVLNRVLPGADDRALAPLVQLEETAGRAADSLRRLATLGQVDAWESLRLSRARAETLGRIRSAALGSAGPAELAYRLGADVAGDAILVRCALGDQPLPADLGARLELGAAARFPVSGRDLMPRVTGPELGAELARIEARWIASDFRLTRAELLAGTG